MRLDPTFAAFSKMTVDNTGSHVGLTRPNIGWANVQKLRLPEERQKWTVDESFRIDEETDPLLLTIQMGGYCLRDDLLDAPRNTFNRSQLIMYKTHAHLFNIGTIFMIKSHTVKVGYPSVTETYTPNIYDIYTDAEGEACDSSFGIYKVKSNKVDAYSSAMGQVIPLDVYTIDLEVLSYQEVTVADNAYHDDGKFYFAPLINKER